MRSSRRLLVARTGGAVVAAVGRLRSPKERSESGASPRYRWIAARLRNDRREHVRQSRRPQLL